MLCLWEKHYEHDQNVRIKALDGHTVVCLRWDITYVTIRDYYRQVKQGWSSSLQGDSISFAY